MPWQPLPRIAFAVASFPFKAESPTELPLEIGDELYIIEETPDGNWLRGYLVAPPSLLAGLTSVQGQTLEARVFSGIFPRSCVEVRELLGETDEIEQYQHNVEQDDDAGHAVLDENVDENGLPLKSHKTSTSRTSTQRRTALKELPNGTTGKLSVAVKRDPTAPKPAAPVPMLKIGDETPTSFSEPLIDEISSCLREWHSKNLHQLLLTRQYRKLDKLSSLISGLNLARQQFLYNVLTAHEYDRLREQTVWNLVQVNKLCGGEVIVRDPAQRGRILTGDDSVVAVAELQSIMSLLDEPPQPAVEHSTLHHLLVDVKGFGGSSVEETSIVVHLVSKPQGQSVSNLSECFSVVIPAGRTIGSLAQVGSTKTLFTDLAGHDVGDAPATDSELFLVVKVLSSQQVTASLPLSRSGTASDSFYSKDHSRSLPAGGNKLSRRSFMWGSMATRSTFSRGSPTAKMDSVNEQHDDRPNTNRTTGSRDDYGPPSTAGSRNGSIPGDMQTAQRLVGVGILKLNSVMKQEEEIEQLINIWTPTARGADMMDAGDGWNPVIRELLGKPNEGFEKSRNGERLQVALKSFTHTYADQLIRATPTMLAGVAKTSKLGFSGAPTSHRSDIYLTLNSAALSRQNLLSRFGGSATSLPSNLQGNNLQFTLEVRRPTGERFENCIYSSSNGDALTTFKSVAADRSDGWFQTLRLALSPEQVSGAHVVMFLADVPGAPFAIAHIPLWDRGAFVRDGTHNLLLYKIDEATATAQAGPSGRGGYLSLPWTTKNRGGSADVTGPLAMVRVETYLCSTVFSQDRIILGLLQWKHLSKEDLSTVLRQLIFVPEIEVVKLLSDILDCLFGVMVEHSGNDEYEDLAFTVLVRVLGIVHDRRFNLIPLVDQYAIKRFNYPYATSCLIQALTRLLENPTEPSTARQLRETLKIIPHILKFIAHARAQQKAKEADLGITTSPQGFSRQLRSIFKALDEMMRNSAPVLVGSQTLAVQHFHTWLPELTALLSTEEILHIAIDFMDSCTNVKGKLILYKLVLIINYSKLDIFASHPDQMEALSANTVRWIGPHWGHTDEVNDQWRSQIRLCCSVLASQMDHLAQEIPDHVPRAIDSYLAVLSSPQKPRNTLSLLFPTTYPFPAKPISEKLDSDETLVELCAILSAMASSPAGMQLELAEDGLTVMLENLLRVQMSILTGDAFPEGWLSVHIYHHKSTMGILQYLAGIMTDSFLPDPDDAEDFNTELWKLFFVALLKLVGSPSLALETFPEQKRRAVWKIAGDVREDGAALLRETWEAIGWDAAPEDQGRYGLAKIGGYQVQYVPTLVGPIVELCMSIHGGLRKMAVEVLQTMIVSEWTLSEDLSVIQTEMIDCLDNYFKTKPLTESVLQKLFLGELLERFSPLSLVPDEPLYAALQGLVGTLDEFLDLLVAVHSADDDNGATDIVNRLRLMEFLRDMQKEEIFVRYVHQLADLQSESRNHAEAGLALRLHADLYNWDPTKQTDALPEPAFPAQSHFERKEKIYFDMIKHFEEGESWSNALTAYKELQTQYETNIFDFAKLARAERAIAAIYESISKSDKVVPKYFKVIYKGLGFPTALRDKHFIFEGAPSERGSAFTDRMQQQYPSARIVTSEDIDEVEGQFLVVSAISPYKDLSHQVYQRTRVPQVIRDFLLSSHPQNFVVTSKRNTSGPVHEHYARKLVFTTAEPFPTIMRRSEIVDVKEVELNAYETALERIVRKTQETAALERRLADDGEAHAQALVDAIAGSVEPGSESSVARYRDLLPQPKERDEDNEDEDEDEEEEEEEEEGEAQLEPRESAIKQALVDHAILIKSSLTLLARVKPDTARQEKLQRNFEASFEPEISILTPQPVQDVMSSPSTTWRGSPSTEHSPRWTNIASPMNGAKGEEVSIVRQVSVHHPKGTRLSFLPGRKKSHDARAEVEGIPHSVSDSVVSHRRSLSKDKVRNNNFWAQSIDNVTSSLERRGSAAGRSSQDKAAPEQTVTPEEKDPSVKRGGSVRKRLSMLKLGITGGKQNGIMGSLDEE